MRNLKGKSKEEPQLPHSEAKLKFYNKYLDRYLEILCTQPWVKTINIIDVFCGFGEFVNDKFGSPIIAFDSIKKLREKPHLTTPIHLIVNDGNSEFIELVRLNIEPRIGNICTVEFMNLDATEMFAEIEQFVNNQQGSSVRNLIFIDPHGYKTINRAMLESLMSNGRTEIILFLPISQMQWFIQAALTNEENKGLFPLKNFIESFFEQNHPIRTQKTSALQFIKYLETALKFGKHYSASYYIQRDASNYYSLFFLSPHKLGLLKILEVKWKLDEVDGFGFTQQKKEKTLFDSVDATISYNRSNALYVALVDYLQTPRTNVELFDFALELGYLPTHVSEILKYLKDEFSLVVSELNPLETRKIAGFYVTWDNANPNNSARRLVKITLSKRTKDE